jgi:hypothetical protein
MPQQAERWIASRSLSSGAHSRDPLARNDEVAEVAPPSPAQCCRTPRANDTIETARAFPDAVIVPVHTDGWAHFRQRASDLRASFDTLGFGARLRILEPGVATVIEPSSAK